MVEAQELVTTGVDALIDLLHHKKLIAVDEAARLIHVRESVLQNWIDLLVEEGIIGVEYKFITPYIFLRTDTAQTSAVLDIKQDFFEKAAKRNLDAAHVQQLWQLYLRENMPTIKEEFYRKLDQKRIPEAKHESLWAKYEQFLRGEAAQ